MKKLSGLILTLFLLLAIVLSGCVDDTDTNSSPIDTNSDLDKIDIQYYIDFQCPACAVVTKQLVEPVIEKYKDQVNFMPIVVAWFDHPPESYESHYPASAFYCAKEQNLGVELMSLFEQKSLEYFSAGGQKNEGLFSKENVLKYVKELEILDQDEFANCFNSDKYFDEIKELSDSTLESGIRATPTIFVDGVKSDAQSLEATIQKAISGEELFKEVKLDVITLEDCDVCTYYIDDFVGILESKNYKIELNKYDLDSDEAKEYLSENQVDGLPAYFLEAEEDELISQLFAKTEEGKFRLSTLEDQTNLFYASNGQLGPAYFMDVSAFDRVDNNKPNFVVFSDYMCPYCEMFYSDVFPKIKEKYIDTNKINLINIQKPIEAIHPGSSKASEAVLCAKAQNAYHEYENSLFANNKALYAEYGTISEEEASEERAIDLFTKYFGKYALINVAADLNLDNELFLDCLDNNTSQMEVESDVLLADVHLMMATPSFFIGNYTVPGVVEYASFEKFIEKAIEENGN
jgi:protein-disulfide isomerase